MPIASPPRKRPSLIRFIERLPSAEVLVNPPQRKSSFIRSFVGQQPKRVDSVATASTAFSSVASPIQARKRISFHKSVNLQLCLHADDYTDEEFQNTWYSPEELLSMKRERQTTLRLINRLSTLPSKSLTFRGLENRTTLGDLEQKANVLSGLMAVINEQAQQKARGTNDVESIRAIYIRMTSHCQVVSHQRGIQDYEDSKS
mmetsp:Transcript_10209/g.14650  ORF Transcript_10209/g.14650 Transcript_10209/m.14650 type:complete len:202 (-) Transcript_10209:69-674(-)